jgi:hypothetical protein|tara:strand:- start:311 stop:637 length:327 start_codon:yes stop_codon:yes gene_type:complete
MKEQETKSVTMFVNVGPMTGCILIWEKIPEALGKYGAVRMYSNDSRDGFDISFREYDVKPLLRRIKQLKETNLHFPYDQHISRLEEDIKREAKENPNIQLTDDKDGAT